MNRDTTPTAAATRRTGRFRAWRHAGLAALAAVVLAGCGAGSVTPVQNPPSPNQTTQTANYNGPAPASAAVQSFKVAFWDNVSPANRCGACHVQGNQAPQFARGDDINLAFQATQPLVNLSDPASSPIVRKVAAGHNCWLASNSACADSMTSWIRNWAGAGAAPGGPTQIALQAPALRDPGASRTFPNDASLFGSTVHPLLRQYCSRCHMPSAAQPQGPFFAQTNVNQAYEAAKAKINLDSPQLSRFYVRLKEEFHHCWGGSCDASAAEMLAALTALRNGITPTQLDPSFVTSKALTLYDGTVASGGPRVENGLVAKFEFKTGTGTVAYDTSGVEPALNLQFSGDVQWVGGWGVRVAGGGKLQGTTTGSRKLLDQIRRSGEYTVEAWVAPANVSQEDAYIVSYSGGAMARNFTLAQNLYDYEFLQRASTTSANGLPALRTPSAREIAQATLQHVVLTYDPVNGRRIYVNGNLVQVTDAQRGGNINEWDDTFALVLGNEVSSNRPWSGVLRLVAVYNRAFTAQDIRVNYDAGVGEKYFLLFSVEHLVNVPRSYVMFTVSQLDSYGYLFDRPTFISLDPNARPGSIPLRGLRVGMNGSEPKAGQSYIPLDVTIADAGYTPANGFRLSNVGAVVPLEKGPASDQFFLTFEQLGTRTNVRTAPVPVPVAPVNVARASDLGVRSFERVNASLSAMTGVPSTQPAVAALFDGLKQALPTTENLQAFVGSHQTAIAQLSIQYCDALVNDSAARTAFFGNLNLGAPLDAGAREAVIDALVVRMVNHGTTQLATQPEAAAVRTELNALMNRLNGRPTGDVVKASCAAVAGSAAMLVK